jgi:DNA-binding SARP family transcriptional activator/pimeloyl-ACP methyl ester carboxylesterase
MRISILGPLEVRSPSGESLALNGLKQRLLLAALLLHAPRVVTVDRLLGLLWENSSPENPAGALRTQVSRLRALLVSVGAPTDVIASAPNGYRLRHDVVQGDLHDFETAVERSRSVPDPGHRLELIDDALKLWRGPPFEEFADHIEFLPRIRIIEAQFQLLRERRIECLLGLRRAGEALADADVLILEDPLRERSHALRIEALYRDGRASDALSAFHAYRLTLRDELGLDPSPALRKLEHGILTHTLSDSPPLTTGNGVGETGSAAEGPAGLDPRAPLRQHIRFCRTDDGVRLAYATVGTGPPLVKAANWMNHLEFDWESPVWRRLFRELASNHTLVRYDERASGLSDWDVPSMSLDAWVRDLESVVDALDLDRFPLLGISQGCAVCVEYAARHPDRVSGLILHGGYAAGWRADPDCPPAEAARRDASIDIVRFGWGEDTPAYRQMFTQTFIPGGTAEEISWFNELERRTVSPENAARFMEAFAQIDVRHRLGEIQAPTLVLHSRGDQRIAFDRGRELAARIPRARFIPLESANHLVLEHEPVFETWIREAQAFLTAELTPAADGRTGRSLPRPTA